MVSLSLFSAAEQHQVKHMVELGQCGSESSSGLGRGAIEIV